MRRGTTLLLAGMLALALAGCGGGSAETQADSGDAETSEAIEQEAEATGDTEAEAEAEVEEEPEVEEVPFPTIEETVLYDNEGVKVVATSLEKDESGYNAVLTLHLENNRDEPLRIFANYGSINGIMVSGWTYQAFEADLEPNSSTDTDMSVSLNTLEEYGIETIGDISMYLYATLNNGPYMNEYLSLSTSATGTFEQTYDDSGDVIYDDNGITIIYKGSEQQGSSAGEYECKLSYVIINSRDEILDVSLQGTVNGGTGEEASHFSGTVAPGCRTTDTDWVRDGIVAEKGLDGIESISYTGHADNLTSDVVGDTLFTFETSVTP